MSRVLLVSTYELGAQPLGLAWPAAELTRAGHEVRSVDLAVEPWPAADVGWAEAVAFSVPMHTALRLALAAIDRLRARAPACRSPSTACTPRWRPQPAPLARATSRSPARPAPPSRAGWRGTARWVAPRWPSTSGGHGPQAWTVSCSRVGAPRSRGLPPLSRHGRRRAARRDGRGEPGLQPPLPALPGPRRLQRAVAPVGAEAVLADVDGLVAAGAGHVRFADPDFLNRPAHALRVAVGPPRPAPRRHVRRDDKVLRVPAAPPRRRRRTRGPRDRSSRLGLRVDERHRAGPAGQGPHGGRRRPCRRRAARGGRRDPAPLLPFTPWTCRQDLVDIVDFVAAFDLVANVDPVQYSIRLLIPPGSLLLEADDPVLAGRLQEFDAALLGYRWSAEDPLLDELQAELAALTERAAETAEPAAATYAAVRALVFARLGRRDPVPRSPSRRAAPSRRGARTSASRGSAAPSRRGISSPVSPTAGSLGPCPSPPTRTSG